MRIKGPAQGHYCRCQQIQTGDLTIESPWSYPLSHNQLLKILTATMLQPSKVSPSWVWMLRLSWATKIWIIHELYTPIPAHPNFKPIKCLACVCTPQSVSSIHTVSLHSNAPKRTKSHHVNTPPLSFVLPYLSHLLSAPLCASLLAPCTNGHNWGWCHPPIFGHKCATNPGLGSGPVPI